MSVISSELMWSRNGSFGATSDGFNFTAGITEAYQVVHTADTTEFEILAGPGITLASLYPGTSVVYCKKISRQPVGPILSLVIVEYEGEIGPGGLTDSPLNMEPEIEYGSSASMEPTDQDADGIPLTNVNGEPVSGLTSRVIDMRLKVKRNYATINGPLALQYLNSTNSDTYTVLGDVWQPGQAALESYSAVPVFDKGVLGYFSVTAEVVFRQAINTSPARVWWHRYRNEGLNVRYGTKVTFSGGSGSGAAGYAVASGGAITAVVVTSRGEGYTSAPSVSFTSTTGGSGATATATISGDEVVSVSVGAGGTGYKSGIERAVDKNKQEISNPVLLKADGSYEPNAGNAVWIERKDRKFSLPYAALGLL